MSVQFQQTKFYRKFHEDLIAGYVEDFIDDGALEWKLDTNDGMDAAVQQVLRYMVNNLKDQCEEEARCQAEEDHDVVKSLLDNFGLMYHINIIEKYNMLDNDVWSVWYNGNDFLFERDLLGMVLWEQMEMVVLTSEVIDGILFQQAQAQGKEGEESEDEDD